MTNIFLQFKEKIIDICKEQFDIADDSILENINADLPKDASHGDIATNAAMVLAKPLGGNPRDIAGKIIEALSKDSDVENADIAGPGFINLKLKMSAWHRLLKQITVDGKKYGKSDLGKNLPVNVEYVSANPTGPMHIGHARNAIVGDVIANLLSEVGYKVTKEYYVNDAGVQIDVLSKSAFYRYKQLFDKVEGDLPEGYYPGEYLIDLAKKFADRYGDEFINEEEYPSALRFFTITKMMDEIEGDLRNVGIDFDVFKSEKELHESGAIENAIEHLEKLDLMYRGVLEPPKGKLPDDWEEREQLLFKATDFGDDVDRPIQKSDESYTYFAADIAYHWDKITRGFNDMVIILGADHGGYVKRLKAIVKALSSSEAEIDVVLSQLVKILENGQPIKMSKRAGNFIMMSEVLDKVGKDVLRFIMLTKKSDTSLDFDLAKVLETTKDNPVFYVQYASARMCSVIRSAEEIGIKADSLKAQDVDLAILTSEKEQELVKKLAEYPKIVEAAAKFKEPHRISFYLQELATIFHQLWSLGKEEGWKFIDDTKPEETKARMMLIQASKVVLWNGLNIIGVDPVEKM